MKGLFNCLSTPISNDQAIKHFAMCLREKNSEEHLYLEWVLIFMRHLTSITTNSSGQRLILNEKESKIDVIYRGPCK